MQTVESLFERELTKLIRDRIKSLEEEISLGALESFEKYKNMCGQKEGLVAALELMADARQKSNQANR